MINQINNNNLKKINVETPLHLNTDVKNAIENKTSAGVEKKDIQKINQCATCADRAYQDVSSSAGTRFKAPVIIAPAHAASVVYRHENEDFHKEQIKAKLKDKEIIKNETKLLSSICPECGKLYIAGGETTTATLPNEVTGKEALSKNEIQGINFDTHA